MKIGIDTFCCDHGRSGTGTYLYYLVSALGADDGNEYVLFGSGIDRYTYSAENAMPFLEVKVPDSIQAEIFWHKFLSKRFYKAQKFGAVLYPAASRMLPSKFSVPGAAVINDTLSMMIAKSVIPKKATLKCLSRAQKIIVPTKFLRNDLISLGLDSEKIVVVRHGIDHSRFYQRPVEERDIVDVKPFAIKRPYILYPSRISGAGKKHIELIKAFGVFKERTGAPHRLVFAGQEDAFAEEVHKAVFASKYASDIFLTGFFPREGLVQLYCGAEACVFPSVQEGAGLPLIEAMASGVPVACSSSGALGETSGGNAILFDSDCMEEMALAIETVCAHGEERDALIKNALEWSEGFTWKKCARETAEILESL